MRNSSDDDDEDYDDDDDDDYVLGIVFCLLFSEFDSHHLPANFSSPLLSYPLHSYGKLGSDLD